ncbi:MAG: hypothetical protein KDA24_09715 [Deltaproteobacteria bacterium]|nr:hypothetical protein [Deltaproteobacteria bacterium]
MTSRLSCLLCLLALLGCPGTPTPQPGGSANYSGSLGDGPDFSDASGLIQVQTWFEYGETALQGSFADGPPLRFHVESQREGNCRLMTYTAEACTPACVGGEQCIQGQCVAYPERMDRGDLVWTWPDGEETVEPDDLGGYWATGAAETAGEVSISVDGLELEAPTIDAPAEVGSWENALRSRGNADATLRWSNPILDARIRLHMTDCIATHGGIAAAEIECEGPDTGELIVADAFLDALEAGDWTHGECGSHTFQRYHSAATDGDDTVRFETVGNGGLYYYP